jgi:REP element-mobilizing transposase RayT
VCVWRQRRGIHLEAWGSAPGFVEPQSPALKARFTSGITSIIIPAMPQSLSKVILHIVFSTKNREPWLDSDVRPRMHAFLATICRDLGGDFVHISGTADHVHIVTTLPRTLSQAQMVEEIKKVSSKWIKGVDPRYRGFSGSAGTGHFCGTESRFQRLFICNRIPGAMPQARMMQRRWR